MLLEPFKHAERLPEAQMFDSLQEVQHVAVRAAAVAMERCRFRIDRKRRRVIFVKGAKTDQGDSGAAQFHVSPDHLRDRNRALDPFDLLALYWMGVVVSAGRS